MKRNTYILAGLLAIALGIFAICNSSSASADVKNEAKARLGHAAPDFALADENGKIHRLSDYKGKTVILEWTNQDCPYVKKHYERKTFNTMHGKLDSKNTIWLAINSTHYNTPQMSIKAKKANKLPYPILQDPDGTVGKRYGAKTTPHMFIIDPKGILAYDGAIDNSPWGEAKAPVNYVENALASILKGKAPQKASTAPYGCSVKYAK